ncbi:integrase [Paraburkholderia sp. MM5477-R1]
MRAFRTSAARRRSSRSRNCVIARSSRCCLPLASRRPLSALTVDDLDTGRSRASAFVRKRGPRIARRVPVDAFALEIVRKYAKARAALPAPDGLLFMATAGGKPMKPATLGQCVRSALRAAGAAAADESPRLLRNTYGRRHLLEGKTNEQVSNLMGLSSHRTATRLRETISNAGEMGGQQRERTRSEAPHRLRTSGAVP